MQTMNLLHAVKFSEARSNAEPLWVDTDGRILRFALQPGQSISKHQAPTSPFYAVVLQGEGIFRGADGVEQTVGPNSLLIFAPGEEHDVRATTTPLVFVGFLQGVADMRADRTGGELGQP
jgi:quercetin dioxygenase-like cupin family protein